MRWYLFRLIYTQMLFRYLTYVSDVLRGTVPHKQSVRVEKIHFQRVPLFNSNNNGNESSWLNNFMF